MVWAVQLGPRSPAAPGQPADPQAGLLGKKPETVPQLSGPAAAVEASAGETYFLRGAGGTPGMFSWAL